MNSFWIYKIINVITNKIYVGQTYNLYNRLKSHKSCYDKKSLIVKSINKYGWDNHKVEVLFTSVNISKLEGDEVEKFYIKKENSYIKNNKNGLNLTEGGRGCNHPKEMYNKRTVSVFEKWRTSMGKDGVYLVMYNKDGSIVKKTLDTDLYGFFKSVGYNTTTHISNIKRRITSVKYKLIKGQYIIGFEDDNPVGIYKSYPKRLSNSQKGKPQSKKTHDLFMNRIYEKQIPVLDINTGVFFETMSDFCKHEGRCFATIRERFEKGKYDGKYLMSKN